MKKLATLVLVLALCPLALQAAEESAPETLVAAAEEVTLPAAPGGEAAPQALPESPLEGALFQSACTDQCEAEAFQCHQSCDGDFQCRQDCDYWYQQCLASCSC